MSGCKRLPEGNICKSSEISGRDADGGLRAAKKVPTNRKQPKSVYPQWNSVNAQLF